MKRIAFFLGLGFCCVPAVAFAAKADVSFEPGGGSAWVRIDNPSDLTCIVNYRVEVKMRLTSSATLKWHDKQTSEVKVVPNSNYHEEIAENDAEDWRIQWLSNSCS